jgi:hypothetical protein
MSQTDRSAPQVSQRTFQARDSASIEAAHGRGSIAVKNRWMKLTWFTGFVPIPFLGFSPPSWRGRGARRSR